MVRGEVCLIGPRPERPEIIELHQLNQRVSNFAERTKVLPGITGLAQINLPAEISVECVMPKVELDLEYIETAGPLLDLRILLCTALRMLGVRHGYAVSFLGLGRKVSMGDSRPPIEAPSSLTVARLGRSVDGAELPEHAPAVAHASSSQTDSRASTTGNGFVSQTANQDHTADPSTASSGDPLPRKPR